MGHRAWSVAPFVGELPQRMIVDAVEECGSRSKRCRKLPAELTVWLIVMAGLFRDRSMSNVLDVAADALGFKPWGPAERPHTTSITQARDRLGPYVMPRLFDKHAASLAIRFNDVTTWHNRPVFTLDGTSAMVPDSDDNDLHFGRPGAAKGGRSGFPQLNFVLVVGAWTHVVAHAAVGPYTVSEARLAEEVLTKLSRGSLLLLDRAYYGFRWPAQFAKHGIDFVIRMKRGKNVYSAKRIKKLGRDEWLCELHRPEHFRNDPGGLASALLVRMIKCRRPRYRPIWIITSLLSQEDYPRDEIAALYKDRWEGELAYRELKAELASTQVKFRSKKPQRVIQEFYGLLIAYNCVRALMCEAAQRAEVRPTQLSFVDSLTLVRRVVDACSESTSDLLQNLTSRRLPPRRLGRACVRAVKIKMPSSFPRKRRDLPTGPTARARRTRSRAVARGRQRSMVQGATT